MFCEAYDGKCGVGGSRVFLYLIIILGEGARQSPKIRAPRYFIYSASLPAVDPSRRGFVKSGL